MNPLRRVLGAPGLWLTLFGLQLALAWALARPIAAATRAALGNGVWAHADRLLAPVAELLADNPAISALLLAAVTASAVLGALLGLLLGGGVLHRLAAPCPAPDVARACLLHLPALAVIGIYGLLLRLALAFAAHLLVGASVVVESIALGLILAFATCAGDLAASRRVVRGDRGLHPREYLRAVASAARSPRLWLASSALSLVRWALVAAILVVAAHGIGAAWATWAARGLAGLACFVGLWRVALAVERSAAEPRA